MKQCSLLILLCAFALTACSSTPSASEAEAVLRSKIEKQSKGLIKLVNFTKTNAQDAELMGVKVHAIEYQAEIEFAEDCYWGTPFGEGFEAIKGEPGPLNAWMYTGKKKGRKGERETITGTLRFQKTEKGWKGEDGKIY